MTELGAHLKKAREEKNMSLDEIQAITKIQKRYLQAIEDGRYDLLPGSFYTKAFVKSYAEAVDLPVETLFEEYGHELPKVEQTIEPLPPRRSRTTVSTAQGKFLKILPGLLAFVLVVGILAVIWILAMKGNGETSMNTLENDPNVEFESNQDAVPGGNEENESQTEAPENPPADEESQHDTSEMEQTEPRDKGRLELTGTSGDTSNFTLSESEKFQVTFTFSGESWLKIEGNSGKTYVNDGFSKGEEAAFDFNDESSVRIRIGSTPHMSMSVNGERVQLQPDIVTQTVVITYEKS